MKPSGPPKRKQGLRRSSWGVRSAEDATRALGRLGRTKPLRAGGQRKPRPPEGPLSPEEWRREVWRLAGGRSIVSAASTTNPLDRSFHAHHPVPKSVLRDRGLYHLVWDPRNGVFATRREHLQHEARAEVIPYERLPARCREFAEELGPWAVARLLRNHPPEKEEP